MNELAPRQLKPQNTALIDLKKDVDKMDMGSSGKQTHRYEDFLWEKSIGKGTFGEVF